MTVQRPEPVRNRLHAIFAQTAAQLAAHRRTRAVSPAWTAVVATILAIVALPLATVIWLALNPTDNIWPHLVSTVLPGSVARTLLLSAGVAALSFFVGT